MSELSKLIKRQEKDDRSRFVSKDARETTVDPRYLDILDQRCGYNYDQYHGWHRDDV